MADDETTDDTPLILDIATLVKRPQIAIDDHLYDISAPGELSLVDSHRIARWGRQFDRLMKLDDMTAAQEKQLGDLVEKISNIILQPVPTIVVARLNEQQRLAVIEVFTLLSLERKTRLAGAAITGMAAARTATAAPETSGEMGSGIGASSLPGSSASMAASPADG